MHQMSPSMKEAGLHSDRREPSAVRKNRDWECKQSSERVKQKDNWKIRENTLSRCCGMSPSESFRHISYYALCFEMQPWILFKSGSHDQELNLCRVEWSSTTLVTKRSSRSNSVAFFCQRKHPAVLSRRFLSWSLWLSQASGTLSS